MMIRVLDRGKGDVSDVIQQIRDLKTQAKNRRDMKRWSRAAALLREAIKLGSDEYKNSSEVPEWRARIASELADCWGILGGVERRWAFDLAGNSAQRLEHLDRSIEAYDKGYAYEQTQPSARSTYNRLNRLIVRVLRNPEVLSRERDVVGAEERGTLDVRGELESLAGEISGQAEDDPWAALDMALLNVLLGRQPAASAYAGFERMSAPDFSRQSALDVIIPLAELDLPTAPEVRRAEQRLRRAKN